MGVVLKRIPHNLLWKPLDLILRIDIQTRKAERCLGYAYVSFIINAWIYRCLYYCTEMMRLFT